MSCVFLALTLFASGAFAAHSLITDNAGTQGKGRFQLELNGEVGSDEETAGGVVDADLGIKAGLNHPEAPWTGLFGIAMRF